MSLSAGTVTTTPTSYTLVFDPEDDGYATTIGIWSGRANHYIYTSNLNPIDLASGEEGISLFQSPEGGREPLYITVFPRGTGKVWAKSHSGTGWVDFFIASRHLL